MTLTHQILTTNVSDQAIRPQANHSQFIMARLDRLLANDITAPVAIDAFEDAGFGAIADAEKIVFVLDHFTPNKDIHSAIQCQKTRNFAQKHNISHLYDVGTMGIEHVLLPEQGLVAPGDIVIGADSHTCTYGALGAFSTGVGSTDFAFGMKTGLGWFRLPEAHKIVLEGALPPHVSGKDVILSLIGKLGVDGARYASLEFFGNITALSMDDRFTIANMAIECGAKNAVFPVDDITLAYLDGRVTRPWNAPDPSLCTDDDYLATHTLDLSALEPVVAAPDLPSNVKPAAACGDVRLDQVVIGSCTNGRLSDLRAAADVLRGKKVAPGVRCLVFPGSQQVCLDAIREGLFEVFIEAGAAVSTPTCGPCLGGHMGCLAPGEVCLSTTNRNFVGRMGDKTAQIWLASPATAAASAVAGRIVATNR